MDKTACVSVVKAGTEEYIGEENGSFRPGKPYPEYPFTEYAQTENAIYDAVREALILLKMDEMHLGTKDWNPLADIIQPGDNVLIKPNMVQERNNNPEGGTTCLYTEPAVIAPVLDYVFKALAGTGSVTVGDAPMQECNFEKLAKEAGYDRLVAYYKGKGLNIQLVDFRKHVTEVKQRIMYKKLRDDVPARVVNLGEQSEYYGLDEESVQKLRIINYPHDNLVALTLKILSAMIKG